MALLFAKRKRPRSVTATEREVPAQPVPQSSGRGSDSDEAEAHRHAIDVHKSNGETEAAECLDSGSSTDWARSFADLGVSAWLVQSCAAVGIRVPTPVQAACIPKVLDGGDVIGCAQTGSGKTAAFALPILHRLAEDPYGPFAVVLTPTRELAVQISEQFVAFAGQSFNFRCATVIGGLDMMTQALALQRRPHVIVATPGRLRDHLQSPTAPDLSRVRFLVLDEADRILDESFASDLKVILESLPSDRRQTLVFSATMTRSIKKLDTIAMTSPFRFDATPKATTVARLRQHYLFIPKQVKHCYLGYVMKTYGPATGDGGGQKDDEGRQQKELAASSVIIFVSTCKMCQTISEFLSELGIPAVALHSMMSQNRRLAALGKFKSGQVNTLVCTDVASRGLDIPEVELVINFDVPRLAKDYIHRVGRTARAGRGGRALTLVSQYDIELLQHIEKYLGKQLDEQPGVEEEEVMKSMSQMAVALRTAKMRLIEVGFDEKVEKIKARNKKQRRA